MEFGHIINMYKPMLFVVIATLLISSGSVSAQTFTDCNPLKKTCPPKPALGKDKVHCNFTQGKCNAIHELPGSKIEYDNGRGVQFTIKEEQDAPTMATRKYIFFGRLDVVVQAAAGRGIITSIVLQSDALDEIDWEWLGGDGHHVQTNYFSKGDTKTHDRGASHAVANPLTAYHKYSIEWTKERIRWLIDDDVVRTLTAADATSAYPQTPMQIKLGTWCAGSKKAPKGTVMWAGGYTDFTEAPFRAYYKSISIVDYVGGDASSNKDVKKYLYGDRSGDWDSIRAKVGSTADACRRKSSSLLGEESATSKATSQEQAKEITTPSTVKANQRSDRDRTKTTPHSTNTKTEPTKLAVTEPIEGNETPKPARSTTIESTLVITTQSTLLSASQSTTTGTLQPTTRFRSQSTLPATHASTFTSREVNKPASEYLTSYIDWIQSTKSDTVQGRTLTEPSHMTHNIDDPDGSNTSTPEGPTVSEPAEGTRTVSDSTLSTGTWPTSVDHLDAETPATFVSRLITETSPITVPSSAGSCASIDTAVAVVGLFLAPLILI